MKKLLPLEVLLLPIYVKKTYQFKPQCKDDVMIPVQ